MASLERRPIVRLALNRSELALSIGVSATSIDLMVTEGVLPPARRWHSRKLWIVSEVEACLTEMPVDGETLNNSWDTVLETNTTHPKSDALEKHYEYIGFDPKTMSNEDYRRLKREAEARWLASIPGTPLGKRESNALEQLSSFGVGVAAHWTKVKPCGPDTVERLLARGFIDLRYQKKFPDRIESLVLTEAGQSAWLSHGDKT